MAAIVGRGRLRPRRAARASGAAAARLCAAGVPAHPQRHRDHHDLQAEEDRSGEAKASIPAAPPIRSISTIRRREASCGSMPALYRAHRGRTDAAVRRSGFRRDRDRRPQAVLAFWRAAGPEKWFEKDAAFDRRDRSAVSARRRRPPPTASCRNGRTTPEGALALVIVLDQFPRNMFRGHARTFAADRNRPRGRRPRHRPRLRPAGPAGGAPVLLSAVHAFRKLADQERCVATWPRRCGDDEFAEIGRAARRHHPPLRAFPPPQRDPGPRHHAGGAGLPRRRRVLPADRMPLHWSRPRRTNKSHGTWRRPCVG